jgi:DNA polymerase III epsilon subunit family exonuclease
MNLLMSFISWLVGVFFLLGSFTLPLVLDVSDAYVTIVLIALVAFSLLIIPPTRRWFSEKTGMNPHRGIVVLFWLLAFGYGASTLSVESSEAESAYERALLDELKKIPTAMYSENLVRYEALVELRPYKQNYKDKVAFYMAKIEESAAQPSVAKLQPYLPKKDENSLGLVSYLLLGLFAFVFVRALLHDSTSQIKDKVVQDAAEVDLRDDDSTEADVVTDKEKNNEQGIDSFTLPEEFIVFDLETTGLSPQDCEIIEIGAIKVNRDSGEHITFQALVRPSIALPSKIIHLTGITQKMINKDGEDIKTVIPEFLDFIGDLRLVAYNARFDMGFIRAATAKQGLKIKNPHSCALKMARRAWPDLESYKLVDVVECGGLSTKGNHRALKDAELTMTVYAAAAETLGSLS